MNSIFSKEEIGKLSILNYRQDGLGESDGISILESHEALRLKLEEAEKDYQELKNKIIVGWDVELLRWKMLSCSTSEYVGKEIPISELGKLVEKLRIK